ncbi:hypothetical protein CAPTEDRAFT_156040 [Capitella teleta]|uniref:Fibulin-1 n=1 Tax=Capitella teleta TaxID=283909 RepID=R7UCC0_CAPTE|nr:hypothetical protein CAPTEDRAFT_156040 [Capitella teleta]|eukprot:ELU04015.1 hypothetical protein CAPTEDRAFT_156040 [Capitella teleta]
MKKRESRCTEGKTSALTRGTCNDFTDDTTKCCSCCKLGHSTRNKGLPCSMGSTYSSCTCREAFLECCQNESSVPATYPPDLPDELNLCLKFPGQLCAHHCIPTPDASYRCECNPGFVLQSDARTCRAMRQGNRCDEENPCDHECIDTGEAIQCNCFDGYMLRTDRKSCEDINECTVGTHTCSAGQTCVNTEGSYACEGTPVWEDEEECRDGFAWNPVASRCEDEDECALNRDTCLATQTCINMVGTFVCIEDEESNDQGVQIPDDDNESGLNCGTGFVYNRDTVRCEDLNECDAETHSCRGLHQVCRNTIGSHVCMCDIGFQYNPSSRECEDMNECAMNRDTCMEGQVCENTIGSYICRRNMNCGTGYTLDRETQQCVDTDECQLGTHNCGRSRECKNVPGSFRCVQRHCPSGFKLNHGSGQCEAVNCPRGYRSDAGGNCVDINECTERPDTCTTNQQCINIPGSYTCRNRITCGAGFEIDTVGNRCQDIDECALGTHDCSARLMTCLNRPGTYLCQCPEGYVMNHQQKTCDDIDECARYGGQVCSLNAECINTEGSFRCRCKDGFESYEDGRLCKDIDECGMTGMCHHECRNTWGSYQCLCNKGYQLATDKRTCEDVDECEVWSERGGKLCLGRCENTVGSYACSCPDGYRMMSDGRTCQDVDECAERTAQCNGEDDVCINIRGGHKCKTITCPKGFVKAASLSNRNNNVKCQRQTFVCPQGDIECLYAPLSYSTNFITFPNKIRVPADLFTMRGPSSPYRRLEFELKLVNAEDPRTGRPGVSRGFFKLNNIRENEAAVQLLRAIEGAQDIELQLNMNIYSREFTEGAQEIFFGTAVARLHVFVTDQDW